MVNVKGHVVKYPKLHDPMWLEREYVGRRRNATQIAAAFGCKLQTVLARLHGFGIPVRFSNPPSHSTGLTPEERFWTKVMVAGDCWLWTASMNKGRGQFQAETSRPGRLVAAHVFSFELANGPVPKGYELHHECETPACVNPAHLVVLTHKEHMAQHRIMREKARAR